MADYRVINFHIFSKVSGDNPVYVESVKPGGAAQKAGLIAGDMISKVRILVNAKLNNLDVIN